jgi:translation initiation factor 1A
VQAEGFRGRNTVCQHTYDDILPKKQCFHTYLHRITHQLGDYKVGYMQKKPHKDNGERNPNAVNADGTPIFRARLPKKWNREQFAYAESMLGANHVRVRCSDGVTRMGRIKGTMKKRTWIREGDTLIIAPWSFQDDKCDIVFRYIKTQTEWLRKNRYLL